MSDRVVFDDLLDEQREFPPDKEFARQAAVSDQRLYCRAKDDFEKDFGS